MSERTLSGLIFDAGSRYGGRTAVITPGERLGYADLLRRALGLSGHLLEAGVRAGDRVVICLPKGTQLSIAIFGVLLAGACYVPIDYTSPAARARWIMSDAGARAIITSRQDLRRMIDRDAVGPGEGGPGAQRQAWVHLCEMNPASSEPRSAGCAPWERAVASRPLDGPIPARRDATAYVLYTSGSTGRPKGVVHTHESAMAFVEWAAEHVRMNQDDLVSQHAAPSFDLTIFDLFAPLMVGAALVSVPEWLFGQAAKTARFIRESGITVWYSVPSALLQARASAAHRDLSGSSLRHVIFAGEVIPKAALRELSGVLPRGCAIGNWFGPTETNVTTFHDITATDLASDAPVPIGIPCPYAEIRLEGSSGAGEEGEMVVSSPTVMVGYHGARDLEGARLEIGEDGRRTYRTGDMACLRSGILYFLGRRDRMTKVRGYRVQPEEIEQVIGEHEDVIEVAVVCVRVNGADQLGAVVAPRRRSEEMAGEFARHCAALLPHYMVPSVFLAVEALPRGPRGKIDSEAVMKLLQAEIAPRAGRGAEGA